MAGWLALHFAIGLAGTWLARRYALRHALVDQPGERRSHAVATPRGGGIAVVASLLLALAWLAWMTPAQRLVLAAAATGLLLVAAIGWADDHRPLSPASRLLVHAIAAALLGGALYAHGAGAGVALAAFGLALVLVNFWNFMDGTDALAASQALLVALGYVLLAGGEVVAWFGLALVAALLGFLPFNLPKALVFMGDVGSGALGFAIATIAALLLVELPPIQWPLLLLPLLAFGVDAGLTLATRIVRGERWWQPHVQHAYQCWARRSGHGRVAIGYALWTVLAVGFMLFARTLSEVGVFAVLAASCLAACVAWVALRRSEGPDVEGNHR